MDSDPYTPPEAKITPPPDDTRRPVRGILFALLFDFVGTFAIVALLAILYVAILTAQGHSSDEIDAIVFAEGYLDPWTLFNLAVGFWFSYYSGRICIRISRGDNFVYPAILAGISTLLVFVLFPLEEDIGINIALTVLSAGFVLYGARSELKLRRGET